MGGRGNSTARRLSYLMFARAREGTLTHSPAVMTASKHSFTYIQSCVHGSTETSFARTETERQTEKQTEK